MRTIKTIVKTIICCMGFAMLVMLGSDPVEASWNYHDQYYNNESVRTEGNYQYFISKENTSVITKYTGTEKAVEIPRTLGGYPVVALEESSFEGNTAIQQLILTDGLKELYEDCFKNCTGLSSVLIHDSVEMIGEGSFYRCSGLQQVVFSPNSRLKTIKDGAFNECTGLKALDIPKTVTTIEDYAFQNCESIRSLVIPDGVKAIPHDMAAGCNSLETLQIGNQVEEIGYRAFADCNLQEIIIPDSVKKIEGGLWRSDRGAFYNNSNTKSVIIGTGIEEIGDHTFYGCGMSSITIKGNVRKIGEGAMENCPNLLALEIPNSVTDLGRYVCQNNTKLKTVTLGHALTSIPYKAFSNCSNLETVNWGDNITTIDGCAFEQCALKSVKLPDSVITIDYEAFCNNQALQEVILPDSVTTIGDSSFRDCTSLNVLHIGQGVTTIDARTFGGDISLETVFIPSSVTTLGEYLFSGCSSLKTAVIGEGATEIPARLFEDCTSLNDVRIGSAVTKIGSSSFENTAVSTILLPEKLASIYWYQGWSDFYFQTVYCVGNVPVLEDCSFEKSTVYENALSKGLLGTVKFDIGSVFTIAPADQHILGSSYVTEPLDPVAAGYKFMGWYKDKEMTQKWDFTKDRAEGTGVTTLYANFVKAEDAVPDKPEDLQASDVSEDQIHVTWAKTPGAAGYHIYLNGVLQNENPVTECSYNISGLTKDTVYTINISAVNNKGTSENSRTLVVRTGTETETIMPGDVDGNQKIDLTDAQIVLKAALKIVNLDASISKAADVNSDGKIDLTDAQLTLKYALKIISSF